MLGYRHAAHDVLNLQDVFARQDFFQLDRLRLGRHLDDLHFLFHRRVVDLDEEHEAVQLRLR